MNLHNPSTASSQFLLALILAGLSACQPLTMPPSPVSSSLISQISPSAASVSSAAPTRIGRTADIVVEKIQDYIYKVSWKAIPNAAYYKLFLDGELFKDKLVLPTLYLNTKDLNRGIQKIGYETFDIQNRFMGYLAQDFDTWPILPKIVDKPQDVNLKSEAEEVLLNLELPYFSEARRYKVYLNDQIFEKGISTSRTISLKVNELESLNKISLEYFDDNFNLLKIYEQNIPYKLLLNNKKIDYTSVFSVFSDLTTIFSISYSSRRKLCSEKFPQKEIPDLIEWADSAGELIRGEIFDDQNKPLTNTTIKIRSVNPLVNFEDHIKSNSNMFIFSCAIPGVLTEIIVTKPGYTTRRRVEVIKANKEVPNHNLYDFGTDGGEESFSVPYNSPSDKPEVTLALPSRNQKQVAPNTAFVLTFSEPMDRQSVENSFAIRSFEPRQLSVAVQSEGNTFKGTVPIQREYQPESFQLGKTLPNYSNLAQYPSGTPIFDSSAFDMSWNADETQATFTFKPGKALPTDKDSTRLPIYTLAFDAFANHQRSISDKSGVSRSEKHFKLTDGDFEEALAFEVQADITPPHLEKVGPYNQAMRALALSLTYSEPMLLKTHSLNIAGGMSDTLAACAQAPAGYPEAKLCTPSRAAENYTLTVKASNGQIKFQGPWSQLAGEARYDLRDPSFKTVVLSASSLPFVRELSDSIILEAAPSLSDPAGNSLSPTQPIMTVFVNE